MNLYKKWIRNTIIWSKGFIWWMERNKFSGVGVVSLVAFFNPNLQHQIPWGRCARWHRIWQNQHILGRFQRTSWLSMENILVQFHQWTRVREIKFQTFCIVYQISQISLNLCKILHISFDWLNIGLAENLRSFCNDSSVLLKLLAYHKYH